ncbi:MAG: nitroreductase family protein [Promethearchaeota archaeon]
MLENTKIIVDLESCTKCKACVNVCRHFIFESDNLSFDKEADEFCIECGKCVAVCPVNAIKLKIHKDEILEDVPTDEYIPSFKTLSNLFKIRRSRRQFKDKSVPKELIEKILNVAGRYSATGHNEENVYFTIVQDCETLENLTNEINNQIKGLVESFEDPQRKKFLEKSFPSNIIDRFKDILPTFKRILKRIELGKEIWRWGAEIIIIHSPKTSMTLKDNCALAACQIMLAAETLGLGTCSLGFMTNFFSTLRSTRKIVNLPRNHVVGYTLAIGYPKAQYHRIPARKPLKATWL